MLHVASPTRGRTHRSHSPTLDCEGGQCGGVARVRSAARAPVVGPTGLFVYDNHNGTHRIAKRARWVLPTRRRRADLTIGVAAGAWWVVPFPRGKRATAAGVLASRVAESLGMRARRISTVVKSRRLSCV
jgi:hypothetical protein